ncbi:MAG: SymE family type I addiction module toxin [Bacteroidota bacterium]
MSRVKTLKIYTKHRARRWDYTTVPEIRLEGRWLEKLGFKEGDQVHIEQQHNKLTITLHQEIQPQNEAQQKS